MTNRSRRAFITNMGAAAAGFAVANSAAAQDPPHGQHGHQGGQGMQDHGGIVLFCLATVLERMDHARLKVTGEQGLCYLPETSLDGGHL